LASPQASAEMLRMLEMRGEIRDPSLDFLGRRLNPRPTIAHLNGTLDGVRNDAGIVDLGTSSALVVILLHDQANESPAEDAVAPGWRTSSAAHSPDPAWWWHRTGMY